MVVTVPFDSTRVIHPDWAQHHMPVTEGAMGATCTIATGGAGGWDPTTGPTTTGMPTTLYTGPCRVQAQANAASERDAAGQLVTVSTYLVALPASSPGVPVGDQGAKVTITAMDANGDQALIGKVLTVQSNPTASLRWERDLTCTLDQTNQ